MSPYMIKKVGYPLRDNQPFFIDPILDSTGLMFFREPSFFAAGTHKSLMKLGLSLQSLVYGRDLEEKIEW